MELDLLDSMDDIASCCKATWQSRNLGSFTLFGDHRYRDFEDFFF